jgi:hypothetical protein
MVGNGHERMLAAWERVEAKLDRLAEVQAEHGRTLALLDRRLSRVEGELDLVKLLIESLRVEVDRKLLRLQDELLTHSAGRPGSSCSPPRASTKTGCRPWSGASGPGSERLRRSGLANLTRRWSDARRARGAFARPIRPLVIVTASA